MLMFCVYSFLPAHSCSLASSWKHFRGKKPKISLPVMAGVKILTLSW